MTTEEQFALGLAVVSLTLLVPQIRYPVLESIANPFAVVLAVGAVLYALSINYHIVATVLIVVSLYLANARTEYTTTYQQGDYLDKVEDDANFDPSQSLDLQIANKTFVRDPIQIRDKTSQTTEKLLTYPPSDATLRSMSG